MARAILWKGFLGIVCLFVYSLNSSAQNLVPNPGFEEIWKKPCGTLRYEG